jgi:phage-related protein
MQTSYPHASSRTNGNAIASLVLGIFSWVIFFVTACLNWVIVPVFAVATLGAGLVFYIITIAMACISPLGWLIGTILGYIAKRHNRLTSEGGAGIANAGFILNLIGLVLTGLFICGVIVYISIAGTAVFTQYFNLPSY